MMAKLSEDQVEQLRLHLEAGRFADGYKLILEATTDAGGPAAEMDP